MLRFWGCDFEQWPGHGSRPVTGQDVPARGRAVIRSEDRITWPKQKTVGLTFQRDCVWNYTLLIDIMKANGSQSAAPWGLLIKFLGTPWKMRQTSDEKCTVDRNECEQRAHLSQLHFKHYSSARQQRIKHFLLHDPEIREPQFGNPRSKQLLAVGTWGERITSFDCILTYFRFSFISSKVITEQWETAVLVQLRLPSALILGYLKL